MQIYDDTTLAFTQKTEEMLREIVLSLGFEVKRTRFLYNKYLYPLRVVIFEGKEWGHFVPSYLQIGLNKKLIYLAKDSVVRDILKHELAHYLTLLIHGPVPAHGKEFQEICRQFGFPKEISEATMNLELSNESKEGDLQSEKILERIKKLLQLAQSSNAHEAELATMKANQLLLRHNLDHLKEAKGESIYLERVLIKPKKDAKMVAIYEILKHFIVRPVFSYGVKTCCLEVSGTLTNVKLAIYISEFLDRELDFLWEEARKEYGLNGLRAKNSFFIGVSLGFEAKMKKSKAEFSQEDQAALVVVEKKLDHDLKTIYRRLGSSSASQRITDGDARQAGLIKGSDLTIRKGVETKANSLYLPPGKK
jgi:predicted SprT family Zn-dependent metalloprotease